MCADISASSSEAVGQREIVAPGTIAGETSGTASFDAETGDFTFDPGDQVTETVVRDSNLNAQVDTNAIGRFVDSVTTSEEERAAQNLADAAEADRSGSTEQTRVALADAIEDAVAAGPDRNTSFADQARGFGALVGQSFDGDGNTPSLGDILLGEDRGLASIDDQILAGAQTLGEAVTGAADALVTVRLTCRRR